MLIRLLFAIVALAGMAQAQDSDVKKGEDLFLYFCAECHGRDAESIGPMAEMLAIEPPGLTSLSKQNGGSFPTEAVAMQIDGRTVNASHGDMPVFGPYLATDQSVAIKLENGQPMLVSEHLANLIAYLQSVQSNTN